MEKAAMIVSVINDIKRVNTDAENYTVTKEWLIEKYEQEENYELCQLITDDYELIIRLLGIVNELATI